MSMCTPTPTPMGKFGDKSSNYFLNFTKHPEWPAPQAIFISLQYRSCFDLFLADVLHGREDDVKGMALGPDVEVAALKIEEH
jgi:hypothetical protein